MNASIALFVYNRPEHTRRAVSSLLANPRAADSELFVFCDGAKTAAAQPMVEQTRAFVRGISGFRAVTVVERERNFGLANSIIDGVTRICEERGQVIVLEDDLVLSPYFLDYMNEGLTLYAEVPQVASIHGYTYPVDCLLPEIYFMRGADCWGWATWARAWRVFEPDAGKLLGELRNSGQLDDFDFGGAAGFIEMLENFIAGKNDSWAVRWHAAAYLHGMMTLYPGRSLVRNIGVDGSGTHSGDVDVFESSLTDRPIVLGATEVVESAKAHAAFARYFQSLHPTLGQRISRRLRRALGLRPVASSR